jgi:hypothetical protein
MAMGFFNERRRFNVALTRASELLVIIGNANLLSVRTTISELIPGRPLLEWLTPDCASQQPVPRTGRKA